MSQVSDQHIIYIHGRGSKPNRDHLQALWTEALATGLSRDEPAKLERFANTNVHMVYFAQHLSEYAESGFDESLDLDNRRHALAELAQKRKAREFRRKHYEALPGKSPLKEFVMDLSASFGFGGIATKQAVPELNHYWQDPDGWASDTRQELYNLLHQLMHEEKNVLIISHCMGSVIAWDSLWQLSRDLQATGASLKRITQWITLGSPLGSNTIRRRLAGMDAPIEQRYPVVLSQWHNIAAEDDYICHDKTVADDYREMLQRRLIGDIRDHTIYNLAIRYGRSNPHSSIGYLVHPRTTQLLSDWLG